MKKLLVVIAVALAAMFVIQDRASAQTDPNQANKPVSQKVIKDPAEYNAYITALNEQDAVKKAALMEAFVQQYPQSIVKVEALEQAMAAYQSAGNAAKVEDAAQRIVAIDAANVR